ncbi:MAG: nuclear transport factor 2 family protein [Flavisolibacter sp.]|jgi:ketosteroid isomerase-like protein|nr:nuclear transport factor 2 family protein [Flavisolibacter sp.]
MKNVKWTFLFFLTTFISLGATAQKSDIEAVKQTLDSYKQKIESLDTSGVAQLFVADSKVIEQAKDEGTISHYLEHHLGPELKDFKSFKFSNYKVDVQLNGAYAYSTESYIYTIILKDGKEIRSQGFATSLLQKIKGQWKIVQTHSSFRKAR